MASKTWAQSFLTSGQMTSVSEAVRRAEATTSGEIVPMIVRRSSAVGHVRMIIVLVWLLLISTLDIVGTHFSSELTVWFFEKFALDFSHILVWISGVGALLSLPAAFFLGRCACVQRCLTSDSDLKFQVMERAQLEFYWTNIVNTENHTGILIFLSLMERQCVVLADEGISKRLPKETWDDIVKMVVGGIKSDRPAEGLVEAITACGKILAQHFPPTAANPNELPNELVVKE